MHWNGQSNFILILCKISAQTRVCQMVITLCLMQAGHKGSTAKRSAYLRLQHVGFFLITSTHCTGTGRGGGATPPTRSSPPPPARF